MYFKTVYPSKELFGMSVLLHRQIVTLTNAAKRHKPKQALLKHVYTKLDIETNTTMTNKKVLTKTM